MNDKKGNRYGNDRVRLETVIPLDTPYLVFIDPSSTCNLSCKFCPCGGGNKEVWSSEKKTSVLSYESYRKIIDDLATFPNRIKTLRLYKEGEPLINKRLPDMIAYARKKDVAERIDFTTNGTLLTHDLSLALMDAGVDRINISIEALNSENYYKASGIKIDFERFLENLDFLYKHRGNCHIFMKISDYGLFGCDENEFYGKFSDYADELSVEYITPVWPEFDVAKVDNKNDKLDIYGASMDERESANVCPYLFYSMCINSDASVSACLMDWNHKLIIGNAIDESAVSIWNGPILNQMRIDHLSLRKDIYPACKNCGQLKYAVLDNIDEYREELLKKL